MLFCRTFSAIALIDELDPYFRFSNSHKKIGGVRQDPSSVIGERKCVTGRQTNSNLPAVLNIKILRFATVITKESDEKPDHKGNAQKFNLSHYKRSVMRHSPYLTFRLEIIRTSTDI